MKHFILLLFTVLFYTTTFAQESEISTLPLSTKGLKAYQGDRQLSENELYDLFKTINCMEAYDSYRYGFKKINAAKTLAISGVVGMAVSPFLFYAGLDTMYADDNTVTPWSIFAAGSVAAFYLGASAIITSIPFYFVGRSQVRNSYEYYNYHCSKSPSITLNVGMTSSRGFGLSLNF